MLAFSASLTVYLHYSKDALSGMNQQDLADKLHIHVTHLSKMGNGHLLPSIDIVQRLMKVFAVSADKLLNDNENSLLGGFYWFRKWTFCTNNSNAIED